MKTLGEIIRRFQLQCHQYEDDTQFHLSSPSNSKDDVDVLNQY